MENSKTDRDWATDQLSLKDIYLKIVASFRFIISKWIMIGILAVIGGCSGVIYSFWSKTTYIAKTTFVLEEGDKGASSGQYAGLASLAGIELGNGTSGIFQGDNILELYRSRKMIQKTLLTQVDNGGKDELLIETYIRINNLKSRWDSTQLKYLNFQRYPLSNSELLRRAQDSIIGVIINDINKNYLKVDKLDKKLSIIKAEVVSRDEFFSKNFNEQIVRNVNDFYIQTKTKKSTENIAILQQKTDSIRGVMNMSIFSAASVADATPNLNPTRQVQRVAPVQRAQFNAETNKSILSELIKNLEMANISMRKEAPLIQIIDSPIYPLEKKHLGAILGFAIGFILMTILGTFYFFFKWIFIQIME